MKIKIMLLVGLLASAVSANVQAMGGARDFARKLFLSKTAVVAGGVACVSGTNLLNQMDKGREELLRDGKDLGLPVSVEKMIKDVFAQDGIDISIVKSSNNAMPVAVFHHRGKSILLLSEEIIDKLTDYKLESNYKCNVTSFLEGYCREERINKLYPDLLSKEKEIELCENENKIGRLFENMKRFCDQDRRWQMHSQTINQSYRKLRYLLPDTITKDEIFASFEHEKSHFKDYDIEKRVLLQATYLPCVILGMKAARLCGRGKLATGAIGLTQTYLSGLFHFAFMRQQEKKCDLSLKSSQHALSFASFFEKIHDFESQRIANINSLAGEQGITLERLLSSSVASHPPHLERARYLREHARFLEEQEKAAQETKK